MNEKINFGQAFVTAIIAAVLFIGAHFLLKQKLLINKNGNIESRPTWNIQKKEQTDTGSTDSRDTADTSTSIKS